MDMKEFFFPGSVLVFGVSDGSANLGKEVIKNLNRFGFGGPVHGIGRKEMMVEGRQVYSDVERVPGAPDLAVLLVPAAGIVDAIRECVKKGITHVVIEAGGFSELGPERRALEEEIRELADGNGVACMGPNCIGVINIENGLCMPFVPFDPQELRKGKNSFIAQSGGLVHEMVRRCSADNVGLTKVTSIGNKLMVDENDVLQYLLQDQETDVVGVYLEDIKNGRRLMNLALGTTKPVIVLKGNASPSAREIARFHTAALLGDEAVTEAALRQASIHQVKSPQEMIECFKIFSLPLMKGPRIAVLSRSGGQSVLLADEAYRYGFSLSTLSSELFDMIGERSKGSVIRRTNPIDLGDIFDESFYLDVVDKALQDDGVDGAVFFFDYELNNYRAFDIMEGVERVCRLRQKPVVLCMVPDRDNWFKVRYSSSFPFFSEPERGLSALRRSLAHHARITAENGGAVLAHSVYKESGRLAVSSSRRIAPARETFSLMDSHGIPTIEYELVRTAEEGIAAAQRMGYPVALKQVEPFILHKTEVGAIQLNIADDGGLRQLFAEGKGDLYLLQKMAPKGVETIIGGKRDGEFGPVIVFGLGGIFVEVLKDVTMRVAPVDEASAREMIGEIKGAGLLKGARGTPPADLEALTKAIVNVSELFVAHPEVASLDVNPFVVFQKGSGGCALDVKMEIVDGRASA
jgi:acetate---CoA ligase (ADP-forming)